MSGLKLGGFEGRLERIVSDLYMIIWMCVRLSLMDSDFISSLVLSFVMKTLKISKILCVLGENFVAVFFMANFHKRIYQMQ